MKIQTLADIETALEDEGAAKVVGRHLAEALRLRRNKDGNYYTERGSKNEVGLARAVFGMIADTLNDDEI